jgi:hypothetical protein
MKLKKLHKSTNLDLYSANTETSLEIPLVDKDIKANTSSWEDFKKKN